MSWVIFDVAVAHHTSKVFAFASHPMSGIRRHDHSDKKETMYTRKTLAALAVAAVISMVGVSAAYADGTSPETTAVAQPTDTTVTPQPEGDAVTDKASGLDTTTDAVDTSSSPEETSTKAPEPDPVAAETVDPTPVAVTEPEPDPAPAQSEAAPVQAQVVATPSPNPTQGSGTGVPEGTTHLDIFNGFVDFQVEQIYVKFDYVINPAITPPTPLQVAITNGSQDVAVQNRTVLTNGTFEYTFKVPGGPFYCLDIRTVVEGREGLQTYNDRKYCDSVKERIVPEAPRETGNNSVIIPSGDPRVVYFDVNTGQVLTGEVRYDTPGAKIVIDTRNADPDGNYSVEGEPWPYAYEPTSSPSPTPTPTSTPKPTVTPTPGPTASPSPTATPKPTPTSTPKPTVSPTPQPSATPTATPTPTQEPTVSPTPQPDPSDTASPIPAGGQPGSSAGNSDKGSSIKYYQGHSGKYQDDNKKTLAVTGQEDPTRPAFVAFGLLMVGGLMLVGARIIRRRNSTS